MASRAPSRRAIVEAQMGLLEQLDNIDYCYGDAKLLEMTCWGCGYGSHESGSGMNRAHIKGASRGGSNDPSNFFLLCDRCHTEQPDGLSRDMQIRWLKDRENWVSLTWDVIESWWAQIMKEVPGVTMDDISRYIELTNGTLMRCVNGGYRSAAGWVNGRANAGRLITTHFKIWWREEGRSLKEAMATI